MNLIRQTYIDKLDALFKVHLIKIITGIRRCGKTTIMEQYIDYLANIKKIDKSDIIYLKYDEYIEKFSFNNKVFELKTSDDLYRFINEHTKSSKTYLFLDEIHEIKDFEKVILHFYELRNYDIYITGSNSHMISSELETKFVGRCFSVHVLPFSFSEVQEYKKLKNEEYSFDDYFYTGGFPTLLDLSKEDKNLSNEILLGFYNQIKVKDIFSRHNIRNQVEFDLITNYVFNNVGNIISSTSIREYLADVEKMEIANDTIQSYLTYLCDCYIFYRIEKTNISGKAMLNSRFKYFCADLGLLNTKVNYITNIGGKLENIVFLNLKYLGYEMEVGKINRQEVDFIAKKNNKVVYIQVTKSIKDDEILNNELLSLKAIKDSFPKYLIHADNVPLTYDKGICIINIKEWFETFKD